MIFLWSWCNLCNAPCIICPKCGNNTCNGGYGSINGETCEVCGLAYQFEREATTYDDIPITEQDVEIINKNIIKDI